MLNMYVYATGGLLYIHTCHVRVNPEMVGHVGAGYSAGAEKSEHPSQLTASALSKST